MLPIIEQKFTKIRQIGLAPSSEASRVGFHFPGDFLFFLLSLHICSSGPGSGTLKVKFSGRLFGFSCKSVVNFRFCRIWPKPRPICSSAHCFLNFLQGSFHHYDKDDENDKDTIVYNADTGCDCQVFSGQSLDNSSHPNISSLTLATIPEVISPDRSSLLKALTHQPLTLKCEVTPLVF